MINLFRRKQPKPAVNYRRSDASFRDHADLVDWARAALASEQGQRLEAFLFSGIPQSVFYRGDKITTEQAALEYMRIAGYMECLARLQEAATHPPKPPADVPIEYPDPEPVEDDQ